MEVLVDPSSTCRGLGVSGDVRVGGHESLAVVEDGEEDARAEEAVEDALWSVEREVIRMDVSG